MATRPAPGIHGGCGVRDEQPARSVRSWVHVLVIDSAQFSARRDKRSATLSPLSLARIVELQDSSPEQPGNAWND